MIAQPFFDNFSLSENACGLSANFMLRFALAKTPNGCAKRQHLQLTHGAATQNKMEIVRCVGLDTRVLMEV